MHEDWPIIYTQKRLYLISIIEQNFDLLLITKYTPKPLNPDKNSEIASSFYLKSKVLFFNHI